MARRFTQDGLNKFSRSHISGSQLAKFDDLLARGWNSYSMKAVGDLTVVLLSMDKLSVALMPDGSVRQPDAKGKLSWSWSMCRTLKMEADGLLPSPK